MPSTQLRQPPKFSSKTVEAGGGDDAGDGGGGDANTDGVGGGDANTDGVGGGDANTDGSDGDAEGGGDGDADGCGGDGGVGGDGGAGRRMKHRKLWVASLSGFCGYTALVPSALAFQFSQRACLPSSGIRIS